MTLVPDVELRKSALPVFFDLLEFEHRNRGHFKQVGPTPTERGAGILKNLINKALLSGYLDLREIPNRSQRIIKGKIWHPWSIRTP